MTNYRVNIAGADQLVEAGTLQCQSSVGKIGAASFTTEGTTNFQQYNQVAVYDQNNVLAFSGYIGTPDETANGYNDPLGYHGTLDTAITCMDQTWLAIKRRISAVYLNKTCGYIVQDILNNILSQEGVTRGQIYDGLTPGPFLYPGPTLFPGGGVGLIPQAIFGYCTVKEALDALATAASDSGVPYFWMIDQNKALWFAPYTTVVNSNVVDGTTEDNIKVTRSNPTYHNQTTVLGGVTQTVTQNQSFKGDNSTTVWILNFDVSTVPTITVNGAAKTVGIKGVDADNTKDFFWNEGDPSITQASAATKLISTDTLAVAYIGQYPNTVISQNASQVAYQASIDGTSGIVEGLINNNSLNGTTSTIAAASADLTLYAQQGLVLTFDTMQTGYAQGQLITVNLPWHKINNQQLLIESVVASDQRDALNIYYTITAIMGPYDVTWVDFFSKLLKTQQQPANINVGNTTSVNILTQLTANIAPSTANLNITVHSLPVPSSSLHPSSSLFPG